MIRLTYRIFNRAIEKAIEEVELQGGSEDEETTESIEFEYESPDSTEMEGANPDVSTETIDAFVDRFVDAAVSREISEDQLAELREVLGIENIDVRLEYFQKRLDNLLDADDDGNGLTETDEELIQVRVYHSESRSETEAEIRQDGTLLAGLTLFSSQYTVRWPTGIAAESFVELVSGATIGSTEAMVYFGGENPERQENILEAIVSDGKFPNQCQFIVVYADRYDIAWTKDHAVGDATNEVCLRVEKNDFLPLREFYPDMVDNTATVAISQIEELIEEHMEEV